MKNEFAEQLEETRKAVKSGTSAVHLCGDDYNRINEFVTTLAKDYLHFAAVAEWNYGYGQVNFETREKIPNPYKNEKMAFTEFLERYKDPKYARRHIILIRNARHVLEGDMYRENLAQLQQTIVHFKKHLKGNSVLIYCDEKRFIPDELTSLVHFIDVKPPSREELTDIANEFIRKKREIEVKYAEIYPDSPARNQFDTDSKLVDKLSAMCIGMSKDSFNQILEKAALEKEKKFGETVIPWAEKTKKQYVEKSGLLRFVNVEVDIENDVGGLDQLKFWLKRNIKAFQDPDGARKMGISPAKGILLVGMPGCGKSLTSKAVAAFFGYPLLALDLGTLMGKYMGESEGNLRRAISLAENSSPCVLWVDEIEKAFAGVGGDESGVSQRLLGYLLTWLNDKKSQVFVMATANDVAVLPPEFLRRGRFDEIFYVDFPSERERKDIFRIHIGKVFGKSIVKELEKEKKLDDKLAEEKVNSREKLEEKLGKKKFDEVIKIEAIAKAFNELTRDKKRADKNKDVKVEKGAAENVKNNPGAKNSAADIEALVEAAIERRILNPNQDKKREEKEKDEDIVQEANYKGTEGYAGSDIEALVNAAVIRFWNDEENRKEPIYTDIFDLLMKEREYMTPLKEVLAEKIKINREKFGKYKLTSASETTENLRIFEEYSDTSDENKQLIIAVKENCPAKFLIKLAKEGSKKVKLAVLDNPSCPPTCISDLMEDGDADVKKKAEEKQSATPAGIIQTSLNGTQEQKLNLLKLKRDLPAEALVNMANNGSKEIIEALLNYYSHTVLPEPVCTALITCARGNEEIKKLLVENSKFPEEKKVLLKDQCCLNCYHRKWLPTISCKLGKSRNAFFWCNDWAERTYGFENYCMWCSFNNGKNCTNARAYNTWRDTCQDITIKKAVRPGDCASCEYSIPNNKGGKDCKFRRFYLTCPINSGN